MRKLLALILFTFAAAAYGHDAWIDPRLTVIANTAVADLRIMVGERLTAEETRPFETARVAQLWMATGLEVRDLRDDRAAMAGRIKVPAGSPAMIAVERIPFDVSLDADRFNTYLEDEGHFELLQTRISHGEYARPARERVTRHLKTFLGPTAGDRDGFLHRFGTRLEILPQTVPRAGKPLLVRILLDGRPLENARVAAFGKKWQAMVRTNKSGEARVVIPASGFVLVRTTHLERCDRCNVDYTSDWAALTFQVQ